MRIDDEPPEVLAASEHDESAADDLWRRGRRRWGHQTDLAIANFPISGEPMPPEVIRCIVIIKDEAAAVNAANGAIDSDVAAAIRSACDQLLLDRDWEAQFPVDVFQTGSGTSTNMNVNEVIADLATERLGRPVHPNDHVNASQSSNDVVPTAIRMAASSAISTALLPAVHRLVLTLDRRAVEQDDTVKLGRTHLMDAAPITFGQELRAWATMVEFGGRRLRSVLQRLSGLPIGGTAVGTGLNAPERFGAEVADRLGRRLGLPLHEATNRMEAQGTADALLEASAACRGLAISLNKIAADLRLLGSGPYGGFAEVELPALQPGSSIMPGKVNPVIPEVVQQVAAQVVGNDAAVAFSSTIGALQLYTGMPLAARCLLGSIRLLSTTVAAFDEKCIRGLQPDRDRMRRQAERSASISMVLVPRIGYDRATKVAEIMVHDDVSMQDALARVGITDVGDVDLLALANPRRM